MALMQWDLNKKRRSLLRLKWVDKGLDVRHLRYCYMAFFTTSGPIGFVSFCLGEACPMENSSSERWMSLWVDEWMGNE